MSFLSYLFLGGIYFHPLQTRQQEHCNIALKRSVTALMILFCVLQALPLRVYSTFLLYFTVFHLHKDKITGLYLTSTFYIALLATKVVSSICVREKHVEVTLFGGLVLNILASSLYIFFVDYHPSIPWVFTALLGCGTSLTLSVLVGWVNKYIILSNKTVIVCCFAGCVGEFIFSPVVGHMFLSQKPMHVLYLVSGGIFVSLVVMVIAQVLGTRHARCLAQNVLHQKEAKESEREPLLPSH